MARSASATAPLPLSMTGEASTSTVLARPGVLLRVLVILWAVRDLTALSRGAEPALSPVLSEWDHGQVFDVHARPMLAVSTAGARLVSVVTFVVHALLARWQQLPTEMLLHGQPMGVALHGPAVAVRIPSG